MIRFAFYSIEDNMEQWIQQELPNIKSSDYFICKVCGSSDFDVREIVYYNAEVDNKSKIVRVDGGDGFPDNTRLVCRSCDEIFTKAFEMDWV